MLNKTKQQCGVRKSWLQEHKQNIYAQKDQYPFLLTHKEILLKFA